MRRARDRVNRDVRERTSCAATTGVATCRSTLYNIVATKTTSVDLHVCSYNQGAVKYMYEF